ncbi:MAG: hypothetical protein ACLU8W_07315 [Clostridia bacterium]
MSGWLQKINGTSLWKRMVKDKKILLLLAAGIAGMLLLLATEFLPEQSESAEKTGESPEQAAEERQSYVAETEDKLAAIISSIAGAGRTKVMVTLENSEESVWATQGAQERESSGTDGGEKYSQEDEYVLIQSSSSEEGGLLLKIIQPRIRGVAIVCDGGDNVYVREKITSAVAAVLDISTAKISIAKMASE